MRVAMSTLYSVPPLRVARLLCELRPEAPLHLPLERRSDALRGTFGAIFRRAVCDPECPGEDLCPTRQECPYVRLFKPRRDDAEHARDRDPPRPFIFRPPIARDPDFGPQRPLRFELRLFGEAIESAEYFLRTFQCFATEGLAGRPARLVSAWSLDWFGNSRVRLVSDGLWTREQPFILGLEPLFELSPPKGPATFDFVTPARVMHHGAGQTVPTLEAMILRIAGRISLLSSAYEHRPWTPDMLALQRVAQQAVFLDWNGAPVERERNSRSTERKMLMSGFVGSVTYDRIAPELWPLLWIGQEIHVGRFTEWGHGWFHVLPLERAAKMPPEPHK